MTVRIFVSIIVIILSLIFFTYMGIVNFTMDKQLKPVKAIVPAPMAPPPLPVCAKGEFHNCRPLSADESGATIRGHGEDARE